MKYDIEEMKKQYPIMDGVPLKDLRDFTYDACSRKHKVEYDDIVLPVKYPNYHQGNVGCCHGCSLAYVMSDTKNTKADLNSMFSPGFIYGYRPDGYRQNTGLGTYDGLNTAIKIGNVKYRDFPVLKNYPYIKEDIDKYGISKLLEIASHNKMEAYVSLEPSEVKEWLHEKGTKLILLVKCYENFYDCLKTGRFPTKGKGNLVGAHSIVIYGDKDGDFKLQNWWDGRNDYVISKNSDTIVGIYGFTDIKSVQEQIDKVCAKWEKVEKPHPAGTQIKWKWIKEDGSYACNEWIKTNNKWYYIGNDQFAYDNQWILWKGKWYFLLKDSCDMATNYWCYWKNKWYYLDGEGVMATDTVIDHKYYVDNNGVWDGITR